jgi:hypothetical protein
MSKSTSVIVIPRAKPRNPHAKAARQRKAGPHRGLRAGDRQRARLRLRGELAELHPPSSH